MTSKWKIKDILISKIKQVIDLVKQNIVITQVIKTHAKLIYLTITTEITELNMKNSIVLTSMYCAVFTMNLLIIPTPIVEQR